MNTQPLQEEHSGAKTVIHDTSKTSSEQKYQLMRHIKNVAFFGYADAEPETELYKEAFKTAQLVAKQGLTIVDGGGPGVMDAATKGAASVGGETIAVTFYPKDAPGFEGRYVGNVADTEVITQNYIERMFKLMEHADAYIIFNGGTGTLSEFGTAWVLARLYFGHHKPFILYGEFWNELLDVIGERMMMRGNEREVLRVATTPEEALAAIWAFDEEMGNIDHSTCEVCLKQKRAEPGETELEEAHV
ncbi:MAG: LOG family protein [Candidatus Pacebacteria bacterium]|nr:LOG family protein [Candidatus Paceibacterota bacterium]